MTATENSKAMKSAIEKPVMRKALLTVVCALLLRLLVVGGLYVDHHGDRLEKITNSESLRIARSLVTGQGFSSPFAESTGPTAFVPPIYPLAVAGIFKLFGGYSRASLFAVPVMNSLASALTCLPIFFLARRLLGEGAALAAGWTWVFFPYAVYIPVTQVWDTSFSPLLITSLVLLTLHLSQTPRLHLWLAFGALWGITALTATALLPALPVTGLWAAAQLRRRRAPWLTGAILAATAFLLVVFPWFVRNALVFDQFVPFRSNLPLELYVGNSPETDVIWRSWLHPNESRAEFHEYARLGEMAYMAKKKEQFEKFLREYPGIFAWLTFKRVLCLWTGIWDLRPTFLLSKPLDAINIPLAVIVTLLALSGLRYLFRVNAPAGWLFLMLFLFMPLLYYITHISLRYRHPLDPLLLILAAVAVMQSRVNSGISVAQPGAQP